MAQDGKMYISYNRIIVDKKNEFFLSSEVIDFFRNQT